MPNRNYRRGAAAERRVVHMLSLVGYESRRSAGSRGFWDVVAVGPKDVRLIQVKCGMGKMTPTEREQFALLPVPDNVAKECWRFPGGRRPPIIDVL